MPQLYVDPANTSTSPGEVFTINVRLFNLSDNFYTTNTLWEPGEPLGPPGVLYNYSLGNLYGLDIKLVWNPQVLNYVNHAITIPVEEYSDGVLHEPILDILNEVDEENGTYHIAKTTLGGPVFNVPDNDGSVFNMTFSVRCAGKSSLKIETSALAIPYLTPEYEGVQQQIPHRVIDGDFRSLTVHNVDTGLDYTFIQEAINAQETIDNHIIYVEEGIYPEYIVINKTVSLIGEDREFTVINSSLSGVAVSISADGIILTGFHIKGNWSPEGSECGVNISSCQGCVVNGNIISQNAGCGITLHESNNNTVSENFIAHNLVGVKLVHSEGNLVAYNNVSQNDSGIEILDSHDSNMIVGNSVRNNDNGIFINNVVGATLCNNSIENNILNGVFLSESRLSEILENNILGNCVGLRLCNTSDSNVFVGNTIINNSQLGILNHGFENTIYHNNFVNNIKNAETNETLTNSWDNGCEGNYWSDYNASDSNGDGLGDLPYSIGENNTDIYPLINRFWNPGDINHDLEIDIYDAVSVSLAYGATSMDPNWSCHSDIAEPYGFIDIFDVVLMAQSYGAEAPSFYGERLCT